MMMQFRKKPVVIEACEVTTAMLDGPATGQVSGVEYDPIHRCCYIRTLEGLMRAEIGDWIIKGVAGELYPCKPAIFAATYEPLPPLGPPHPTGENDD